MFQSLNHHEEESTTKSGAESLVWQINSEGEELNDENVLMFVVKYK